MCVCVCLLLSVNLSSNSNYISVRCYAETLIVCVCVCVCVCVHSLMQLSVTTLSPSSHSSPFWGWTVPSPQNPSGSGAFSVDWNGVSWNERFNSTFHQPNQHIGVVSRGGLAIGDTGGIPGGPTRLGWSKIPAHIHHQPALPLSSPAPPTIIHTTQITYNFLY